MNIVVYLYDLIYILPICVAALRLICPVTEEVSFGVLGSIVAVLICGVLVVIRHIDGKLKIVISGVTVALMLGVLVVLRLDYFQIEQADARYLITAVLIAIGSFIFGRIVIRFSVMRYILSALIIATLVVCMVWLHTDDKLSVAFLLFVLVIAIVEIVQKWNKSYTAGSYRMDVVYVLPFIMLFLLAIVIVKIPDKPYDWRHVKKIVDMAEKYAENTTQFVEWRFSTKSTFADVGFSEKAQLRSGIISNPSKEMSLETRFVSSPNLYIAGKVFDTFDGNEWHSTYTADTKTKMLDTMETLGALKSYSPEHMYDYVIPARVTVQYITAKTPYVFTPQKSVIDDKFMDKIDSHMEGDNLLYEKVNKFKVKYEVIFERLNYRTPEFVDFLNSDVEPQREVWEDLQREYTLLGKSGYSYDDYQSYKESIYDIYTEDIELSEDMKEILGEYIKEGDSDYEKAVAIEKLLSSCKYNTEPGDIPENVNTASEFIDYFVINKQEGFCTYYATAFVLLARAQGLPARYVQGFLVPMEYESVVRGNEKSKLTYVMSDKAHAWPEVYFEGKGWVPFEPTPGYYTESGWLTSGEKKEFTHTTYERQSNTEDSELPPPEEIEEEEVVYINPMTIVIPILPVLSFLAIFITVSKLISGKRYKKTDTEAKVINWSKKNLSLLNMMGKRIEQGETLEEYKQRLIRSIDGVGFIDNYELLLYSSAKATDDMIERAIKDHALLLVELKRRSKFMYIVYRVNMLFR